MKILIKELKEILNHFEDVKAASIFLQLTSNFRILYEIEDWADNNGHLNLLVSDSTENMRSEIESIDNE